jgi:ABC-type hemin transport system ATPase subunit
MVVVGPNGSGKSTLLNGIRSTAGYSNIVYVGPHRAMRKQQVQQRHLLTHTLSYESLLANPNVPSMEGIRLFDGTRDPWGYDESANYLKHTLCQIEVDRLQAIGARLERDGEIAKNSLADSWRPLRELTSNLLPHMSFEKIDATNRDQVRVLFRVHKRDAAVDLDDLSSGEKSIIQMFYPLIERDIKAAVTEIAGGAQDGPRSEMCVLIDEPELHLHPNLQLKILDYLRVLTSKHSIQAIVASHSPTLVEAATFEELYLLKPVELVPQDENQLVQVANDEERLEALRSLFGATHNLTSLMPVVVVEGVKDSSGRAVPDRQLYRALHPQFDRVTLLSGGGKSECLTLVKALRGALGDFSPSLAVTALLDRDVAAPAEDEVSLLPVSMIENFFVDPDVLYEATESVRERIELKTVDEVAAALEALLDASVDKEVGRRAASLLGSSHFYPPSTLDQVNVRSQAFLESVQARYSSEAIVAAANSAKASVEAINTEVRRREEYDGKRIVSEFFKTHLHGAPLSRPVFFFYAARRARRRKAVTSYFERFFSKLLGPPAAK